MRSLFDFTLLRCLHVSSRRKCAMVAVGFAGIVLSSAAAAAAGPALAADEPQTTSVTQSTTTTVTTSAPTASDALPPPPTVISPVPVAPLPSTVIAPVPVAPPPTVVAPLPVAPLPVTPLPPAPGVQGPVYFNGPVWIIPAQPGASVYSQPMLPRELPPPPVYVQPPRIVPPMVVRPLPRVTHRPVVKSQPRGPVFGMGVRFVGLGIQSQEVFGEKPTLWGGGIQMRFRNQGHWGFELALDALKANIGEGAYQRTSYPFSFSPMLYLFRNRPDTHFNIYGTAGFGLMASDITLYEGSRQERGQQFWEVLGQAGGGFEIRFTRLAISVDLRAIGMLLDQGSEPGNFYDGVDSGPISPSSIGYKANFGIMYWF